MPKSHGDEPSSYSCAGGENAELRDQREPSPTTQSRIQPALSVLPSPFHPGWMLRAPVAFLRHLDELETFLKRLPGPCGASPCPLICSAADSGWETSGGTPPPSNEAVFDLPLTRSG